MNTISFFAQGTPKGQPRPRAFARKMGNGKFVARVYDAGTAENWKGCVAIAAKQHLSDRPIREPIAVDLAFLFLRPKSHFRTGKLAGKLRPDAPLYHTGKPDNDNLEKAVWDALVQIGLIADDSFICDNHTTKLYAFGPRTGCQITIGEPHNPFAQEQWEKENKIL